MTMQLFTGKQYLQIDIANHMGHDKLDWDDRLAWFEANEPHLESLMTQAEEPALYFAAVKAYRDVQKGLPIGYCVGLDATSSGLQLLACLTGDRSAAELCNVVDTGHREDAYTNIYDLMLQRSGGNAKIKRSDTKQAIMTSLYSSTAMPKKIFGEGELLELFYDILKEFCPAAWELNETMRDLWNPTALSHDWVLPDNFHVRTKVMDTVYETIHFDEQPIEISYKVNQPMPEGRALGANMVHSIDGMIVREIVRRCSYDQRKVDMIADAIHSGPRGTFNRTKDDKMVCTLWANYLETGYLSARILDHLNEDNLGHVDAVVIRKLLNSLPNKPFSVMPIHDCFRCLPHYANDLRRQYNLQLQMIAESELLSSIISQLIGRKVQIGKLDPTLAADIAASNYSLS
jgi:hypothetical protein